VRRLFVSDTSVRDDDDDDFDTRASHVANDEQLVLLELNHAYTIEALEETIAQIGIYGGAVSRGQPDGAHDCATLSQQDVLMQDEYEFALAELMALHVTRLAPLNNREPERVEWLDDSDRERRAGGCAILDQIDLFAQDAYELALAEAQDAGSDVLVFAAHDGASRLDVRQMSDECELAVHEARCRDARARLVDVQDALELERYELNLPSEREHLNAARRLVESRANALQRRVALLSKTCAQQRDELTRVVDHERSAHNARLHVALSEQRAELERNFQARVEWASKQRAAREAADRQKRSLATAVGMARGAAVARDLARMAPPDALL
jgi:hypothetical protein